MRKSASPSRQSTPSVDGKDKPVADMAAPARDLKHQEEKAIEERQASPQANEAKGLAEADPRRAKR